VYLLEAEITLLLEIGLILSFGVVGSDFLKKINVPEILGFILVGIVAGIVLKPMGLFQEDYATITNIVVAVALGFIGFNLGSEIDWNTIKSMSSKVIIILLFEGFITFFLVGLIILFITEKLYLAMLFGALASATAPAGTAAVFWEFDCKGTLTTTTMLILALDDIMAIILTDFAIDYAAIELSGLKLDILQLLLPVFLDVFFSVVMGLFAGILLSMKLNREKAYGESVDLLIGAVLVCIGLSGLLGISYILPTMVFGVTIASLCKKPVIDPRKKAMITEIFGRDSTEEMIEVIDRELLETRDDEPHQLFHEVYKIASPLIALFFVLIGLNLELSSLTQIGLIGFVYLLGRTVAKTIGAYLGATIVHATKVVQRYLGSCLYSQAGVALGLAVLISDKLAFFGVPEQGLLILNTITATTVIFQIFGPVTIKWAIGKSGEARR